MILFPVNKANVRAFVNQIDERLQKDYLDKDAKYGVSNIRLIGEVKACNNNQL